MNDPAPVGMAWVAILGFIRISTHRSILENPLQVDAARDHVRSWLARPQVKILHPLESHAEILFELLGQAGTGGNLTTDAHLAALAIEHTAVLHTTDTDFSRFTGVRWTNPLA
jgi:toxin-antitoxin system PIN domain toxin